MGIGDSLKKWAQSKATEMLTADSGKRDSAAASADAAEQQAKSDVGEQLLRTAFPKLGEFADKQEADRAAREQAREQERRDEIASLPLATVQLSVTGQRQRAVVRPASPRLERRPAGAARPGLPLDRSLRDKPLAWIELFAEDDKRPVLGGLELTHWGFQIPGYAGDGSYDLTAIAREREAAGAALDYLEWAMDFANADESSLYFYAEAGPSSITVADGGKRLSVSISMGGTQGDVTATAEITRRAG